MTKSHIEQAIVETLDTWPAVTALPPIEQYQSPVEAVTAHLAAFLDDRLNINGVIPHYEIIYMEQWRKTHLLCVHIDQCSREHIDKALNLFDEMGEWTCSNGPYFWELRNITFLYCGPMTIKETYGEKH